MDGAIPTQVGLNPMRKVTEQARASKSVCSSVLSTLVPAQASLKDGLEPGSQIKLFLSE